MSLLGRLRGSLSRTKQQIVERFDEIVRRADEPRRRAAPVDVDTIEALEELLISADVGVAAATRIVTAVKTEARSGQSLRDMVQQEIRRIFAAADRPVRNGSHPRVVLVVGVNGTGKTTTVGKLANLLKGQGQKPLICAADTFRAAAVEQLEIWAARAGVDMIRARPGADPAAVVFDAISSGKATGRDPILVDTAGRLHTRVNLMNELEKICRVVGREVPGAPHEVLLVLDATVGQNGAVQAREFMSAAGVNGIVLAKLDGTAKGGVAVAIANDLKLPIRYVGIGEGIADLVPFDADEYVDGLFESGVVTETHFMDRALFHAARGRGRTSPNPLVGAVVVSSEGVVVGYGSHERLGGPHAEVRALEMAGRYAPGLTLYCTLEPCCHFGRTGPCAPRIVEAGIVRVVAAVEDPNPVVRGRGFAYLRSHGVVVDVGVQAEAAARLNGAFFTLMRDHRPLVLLKAATSADGCIARAAAQRTRLTSAGADRHAHRFRAEVDAIGVGSGTILADDPLLTARGAYRERPLVRVIFDRRLRTPDRARVLSTRDAGPVIIITTGEDVAAVRDDRRCLLEDLGAEIDVAEDGTFRAAIHRLAERGISSLLLEGGAALHSAAWDEGLVDVVRLYVTPHVIGGGGVPFLNGHGFSTSSLVDHVVEPLGPDILIEGHVKRPLSHMVKHG